MTKTDKALAKKLMSEANAIHSAMSGENTKDRMVMSLRNAAEDLEKMKIEGDA